MPKNGKPTSPRPLPHNLDGHSPHWWNTHPDELKKRLAELEVVARAGETPTAKTSWYSDSAFQVGISLGFGILATVVAAVVRDARWMVFASWPFFSFAIWRLLQGV